MANHCYEATCQTGLAHSGDATTQVRATATCYAAHNTQLPHQKCHICFDLLCAANVHGTLKNAKQIPHSSLCMSNYNSLQW